MPTVDWLCGLRPNLRPEDVSSPHDVIIILGAKPLCDGLPGPAIERRVTHGVKLYTAGRAPNVLMSGGVTQGAMPEAEIMRKVAADAGVPAASLHSEEVSTRTFENARECCRVMGEKGWRKAIVVTDHFHMRRALMCFESLGCHVTPDPVRLALSPYLAAAHVREFFARLIYALMIRAYMHGDARG